MLAGFRAWCCGQQQPAIGDAAAGLGWRDGLQHVQHAQQGSRRAAYMPVAIMASHSSVLYRECR